MSACDPLREMYEAYVLGALDGSDREAFEAHLSTGCKDCARAVDEARWLVSQLAYMAPEAEPSDMLKGRLMQAIRAEAVGRRQTKRQTAGVHWWMWAAVAALAVMSAYSAWEARKLQNEIQLAQTRTDALIQDRERLRQQLALADRERTIVSDPASVQIPMPAGEKEMPGMRAYWHAKLGIVVAGLRIPAPPSNRALQLWLVPKAPGAKPRSAGMLQQRADGTFVALVPEPPEAMDGTKALAITEEPPGGSPQPTSTPRWVGGVS